MTLCYEPGKLEMMSCVLQIVNGGPLPPNVIHEAVSVFDAHGRYIGENVGMTAEPDVAVSTAVDTEVKSARLW